ncbi:MAG: hypothetical protein IKN77_02050 [Paludibacteraceae bacterium]|nr:hypothetical protein [Paludibacteraceae bacterium]
MEKPIGGYYEIEKLSTGRGFPHPEGVFLNTGRNCLEYILLSIGNVKKAYIPYYTCIVVLEPFEKLGIPYEFYSLDEHMHIREDIEVKEGECIVYNNYFGVMDDYVALLFEKYGKRLIIDAAQALYAKRLNGLNIFYSPRKFVGLSDSGVAFVENGLDVSQYPLDDSSERMSHLFLRKEKGASAGYELFKENTDKLIMNPIRRLSVISRDLMSHIDFDEVKEKRNANFAYLHERLRTSNKLCLPSMDSFASPMVYPYWTDNKQLKSFLISHAIFVATYWPNVYDWTTPDMLEHEFADNLLAIPCDQRYDCVDMERIVRLIQDQIGG